MISVGNRRPARWVSRGVPFENEIDVENYKACVRKEGGTINIGYDLPFCGGMTVSVCES